MSITVQDDLATRRIALATAEPRLYPRDLAARLGVTEAEIVALDEGGLATRLRPDWPALLGEIGSLGEVMALTRNADAVHEKTGIYGAFEGNAAMGLFVGEAIDLRLFLRSWKHGWAMAPSSEGGRASLQFYAGDGTAVHKIFTTANTDRAAWARLVAAFVDPSPAPLTVTASAVVAAEKPDAEIDVAGFHAAWDALEDTHHFHALLGRFGVSRTQALRLAGPVRARPVATDSLRRTLESAAASGLSIMVFVGNAGCIQIHTGPVAVLKAMGPWFNVLDPGFNLHLREGAIDRAWVVAKPTSDGTVTSLELFDAAGSAIATLFGARKPGKPELAGWRDLCAAL